MVLLKNIRIEGSSIRSDVYPEDSVEAGRITVDIETGEVKERYLPANYQWCKSHLAHAQRELITIAQSNNIPKEKVIVWY